MTNVNAENIIVEKIHGKISEIHLSAQSFFNGDEIEIGLLNNQKDDEVLVIPINKVIEDWRYTFEQSFDAVADQKHAVRVARSEVDKLAEVVFNMYAFLNNKEANIWT
jgi:hypothetical protein